MSLRLWVIATVSSLIAGSITFMVGGEPDRTSNTAPTAPAQELTPVFVELFTSEGCSSCPPADELLAQLSAAQPIQGREVIALGQHVDYWDRLGWKDAFSSADATARQRSYAAQMNLRSVYTPQMIVNGTTEFVGSNARAAREAIQTAPPLPLIRTSVVPASPAAEQGLVTIELSLNTNLAEVPVFVAVIESGLTTEVRRGENAGRTIAHAPIVRLITRASPDKPAKTAPPATASDTPKGNPLTTTLHTTLRLDPSWKRSNLRLVAFAQPQEGAPLTALGRSTRLK